VFIQLSFGLGQSYITSPTEPCGVPTVAAEPEKRTPLFYARVAGFIYLFAMALSILSQMIIPDRIVVSGDAAATARNIVSFEGTFRLGIAIDVVIFVSDVVIAWAFYELLRSVDRSLALLGAFLRVADGAILAVTAFSGLITLRLLSGADYLQAIPLNQLQGLARLFISVRGSGFYVGFVFLGLGSAVFAYLLLRSRYVPRALAGWGVFASLVLAIGSLAVILSPWFAANAAMIYMVPMFFYEVPLGLWFLIKGVEVPATRHALAGG
jgi:hypothetical protein